MAVMFGLEMKRFAEETPRISTRRDLDAFGRMAKRQMYAALAQIVILGLPVVLYVVGLLNGTLRNDDFLYVVVPGSIVFVAARLLKGWERRVQSLPVDDGGLERERDAMVRVWMHRPFPDW